ncbi:MAG: MOSC domain-containing protein [Cyclobacteriaceae bacterium]|nr:MOSC domain-containing protein [Cyclobacteriaceae bacterium]
MSGLRLSEIWIYPIKSMGGIRLNSAKVAGKGLEFDRRWMLIDENNMFITQRKILEMALFKLEMNPDSFTIRFNNESIQLPFNSVSSSDIIQATIWDDSVDTIEVDKGYSNWFSDKLKLKCKLVVFPEKNTRLVDPKYATNCDNVSLADGYPLLAIGQSSLDDLNQRLDAPVPMDRFRPNLVFTGGQPYEEDSWKEFTVGTNKFLGVKRCSRCVLTTIDQITGEQGKEPLATLATYRKQENKIYFGQNILSIDHNEIHKGDEIKLL